MTKTAANECNVCANKNEAQQVLKTVIGMHSPWESTMCKLA